MNRETTRLKREYREYCKIPRELGPRALSSFKAFMTHRALKDYHQRVTDSAAQRWCIRKWKHPRVWLRHHLPGLPVSCEQCRHVRITPSRRVCREHSPIQSVPLFGRPEWCPLPKPRIPSAQL